MRHAHRTIPHHYTPFTAKTQIEHVLETHRLPAQATSNRITILACVTNITALGQHTVEEKEKGEEHALDQTRKGESLHTTNKLRNTKPHHTTPHQQPGHHTTPHNTMGGRKRINTGRARDGRRRRKKINNLKKKKNNKLFREV